MEHNEWKSVGMFVTGFLLMMNLVGCAGPQWRAEDIVKPSFNKALTDCEVKAAVYSRDFTGIRGKIAYNKFMKQCMFGEGFTTQE